MVEEPQSALVTRQSALVEEPQSILVKRKRESEKQQTILVKQQASEEIQRILAEQRPPFVSLLRMKLSDHSSNPR
jgi:hypothetical protein